MEDARLGDLVDIVIGKTPSRSEPSFWHGTHPWVAIRDLNAGPDLRRTKECISNMAVEMTRPKLVAPGTVLFSFKLSIGKTAIAAVPLYTNEAIAALPIRDETRVLASYLRRALEAQELAADSNRATMGLTLNKAALQDIRVPLPTLDEQRRIAAILDQADELRAKRRRTLALLDELPERIFAERFLDVGRALNPLGDLAAWQSGGTPSRSQTAFFSGDIPWMTSGELGPVRVMVSNEMLTTEAVARSSAKMIPHGSLLLGMYDTAALKSSISVGRIACNQAVAFGVPSSGVSPEFLYFAVRSQRASVLARRRGARQKNLNLSMIRSITVPVASAAEQTDFADVVQEVEALRAAAEAHLAHLDELFASLQHRAFTGQL
ncbi:MULTISPECIES: restriction endonuclease subunit S [unclassified Frigoribacterium]|uniref:restriction endonuclease subunit S n=1 Tax=unclassified Frigoribacterium TaxID=2627005 RepID=UPI0027DD8426|nr:restriction endonuclease subunit S [Frigoribacterium sp. PvP121]